MDLAYDHIQEDAYPKDPKEQVPTKDESKSEENQATLNSDFQDAYKAFSNSPWGARIGGFLGTVVKQVCGDGMLPLQALLMIIG